jgi:hypothetical protein
MKKTQFEVAGVTILFIVLFGILGAELGRAIFFALILFLVLAGIYYPIFLFRRTRLGERSEKLRKQ